LGILAAVRPVPSFLPGANSKKWHNRRWWDPLGYLRVRTLANPGWVRDAQWLIDVMTRSRPNRAGPERDQYDRALERLRTYAKAHRQGVEPEEAFHDGAEALWDEFLEATDAYLKMLHDEHLRAVDEAGVSGR
jgi:hypothetical protein